MASTMKKMFSFRNSKTFDTKKLEADYERKGKRPELGTVKLPDFVLLTTLGKFRVSSHPTSACLPVVLSRLLVSSC